MKGCMLLALYGLVSVSGDLPVPLAPGEETPELAPGLPFDFDAHVGKGSWSKVENLVIKHEHSHLHPDERPYVEVTGNHQPFPDVISINFDTKDGHYSWNDLMITRDHLPEDAHVSHVDEEGNEVKTYHKHHMYSQDFDDGSWVSVQMLSDTEIKATLYNSDGLHYVDTLERLARDPEMQGAAREAEVTQANVQPTDLLFLTKSDLPSVLGGGGNVAKDTSKDVEATNRRLLDDYSDWQGDKWANCWPGGAAGKTQAINVHIVVGQDLVRVLSSGTGVANYVQRIIADTNKVYRGQLHVDHVLAKTTPLPSSDTAAHNNCQNNINTQLDSLTKWRGANGDQRDGIGLTAVLNTCWKSGVIGLAWVGTVCGGYGSSINSGSTSNQWPTYAHEIGHNFAASHSFENGQGRTGGIMDYGGALYKGRLQFNELRRNQICGKISSVRSQCFTVRDIGGGGGGGPQPTPGGGTGPNPTPRPTPAPVNCQDNAQYAGNCPGWKGAGYCQGQFETFMTQNCPKSCGKCTTGGTNPVTCTDSTQYAANCPGWQQYCQDARYTTFMAQNCKKTCNKCTGAMEVGQLVKEVEAPCPDLEPATNSQIVVVMGGGGDSNPQCTGMTSGGSCQFKCNAGYQSNGNEYRTCYGGQWTGSELVCFKKLCPTLLSPHGAELNACIGKGHGETCSFKCSMFDGYTSAGSSDLTCKDGYWMDTSGKDPTPFTCSKVGTCPDLMSPVGAVQQSCVGMKPGDFCNFTCGMGYIYAGEAPTTDNPRSDNSMHCGKDFKWDANFSCALSACGPLDAPANAAVYLTAGTDNPQQCAGISHGKSCTFACLGGYHATGDQTRTCFNGEWLGTELKCEAKVCPELQPPENAKGPACAGFRSMQECIFTCNDNYFAVGDASRTCINGAWTGYTFTCVPAESKYAWQATDFGSCSKTCGGGLKYRTGTCMSLGGTPVSPVLKQVDNSICDQNIHELLTNQTCNTSPCHDFKWSEKEYGACESSCGPALQRRQVVCEVDGKPVDPSMCAALDKPLDHKVCQNEPCKEGTFHWLTTPWETCSKQCDTGTRKRTASCQDHMGNLLPMAQSSKCGAAPALEEACTIRPCANSYSWRTCTWEPCTAECNGAGTEAGMMAGVQSRMVFCTDASGKEASEALCSLAGPKPQTMIIGCNPQKCTNNYWMTTPWGACGQDGKRRRTYHCHLANGLNGLNEDCATSPAPTDVEECKIGTCVFTDTGTTGKPTVSSASSLALGMVSAVLMLLCAVNIK